MNQDRLRAVDTAAPAANYDVAHTADGWTIFHDGRREGALDTKTAAFDSAVAAAVVAIRSGRKAVIKAAADMQESEYEGKHDEAAEPAVEAASVATYEIERIQEGWTVVHDGRRETVLDSKMAAFDAAVGAAIASLGSGLAVLVSVPAASERDSLPRG